MKIGSRKILFQTGARGNYTVMNRKEWKKDKPKHRNNDHSIRKGLASKLRHKGKLEIEQLLIEETDEIPVTDNQQETGA